MARYLATVMETRNVRVQYYLEADSRDEAIENAESGDTYDESDIGTDEILERRIVSGPTLAEGEEDPEAPDEDDDEGLPADPEPTYAVVARPDVGDFMPWEEFHQTCLHNVFTDDDGYALPANTHEMDEGRRILPSAVVRGASFRDGRWTHVVWFGR